MQSGSVYNFSYLISWNLILIFYDRFKKFKSSYLSRKVCTFTEYLLKICTAVAPADWQFCYLYPLIICTKIIDTKIACSNVTLSPSIYVRSRFRDLKNDISFIAVSLYADRKKDIGYKNKYIRLDLRQRYFPRIK